MKLITPLQSQFKSLRLFPILLLAFFMAAAAGCTRPADRGDEAQEQPADYYSMIRSANKLILSEMTVNKIASVEDLKWDEAKGSRQKFDALLNCFKIGTRKGAYSYNTYLRAYIDLNELRPEDVEADTVTTVMRIRLPEVHTEFAGRDVELREDHYRVTGLRSQIRPEERARVKEAMNDQLKEEVEVRSGFKERLKATAKEKAVAYFTSFAEEQGFKAEILNK